mgnify:CR=1 FL=1
MSIKLPSGLLGASGICAITLSFRLIRNCERGAANEMELMYFSRSVPFSTRIRPDTGIDIVYSACMLRSMICSSRDIKWASLISCVLEGEDVFSAADNGADHEMPNARQHAMTLRSRVPMFMCTPLMLFMTLC